MNVATLFLLLRFICMYKNVKKVLVTGGIVSSLLLTGTATTFAQTSTADQVKNVKPMERMLRADHLADMAAKIGLNTDEIKKELDAGKKWPDILKEHNITPAQMHSLLGKHVRPPLTDDQIAGLATKLNLKLDEIKAEIAAGKGLPTILKEHNITQTQMKTAFGDLGLGVGSGKGRGGPRMGMSPEMLGVQANILGISTDELKATLKNRETLKTIIESKGLTVEIFHQKVNAQILQMITDGKITGTQAQLLEHMINHKVGNKTEVKVQS